MSDERSQRNGAAGTAVSPRVAEARSAVLALAEDDSLATPMRDLEALLFSGSGGLDDAQQEVLLGHMRAVFEAPAMRDDAVDQAVGQWLAVVITVAGPRADPLVQPVAQAFWWRGKETELPSSREVDEVMHRFLAQTTSSDPLPSTPRPSAAWYGTVALGAMLLLGLAMLAGWLISGA